LNTLLSLFKNNIEIITNLRNNVDIYGKEHLNLIKTVDIFIDIIQYLNLYKKLINKVFKYACFSILTNKDKINISSPIYNIINDLSFIIESRIALKITNE